MDRYVMTNKHGFREGQIVSVGGLDWAIIETFQSCVRCITVDCVEADDREFDEYNGNDYSDSTIREWLECVFLKKLLSSGVPEEMFCEFGINLTADDGTTGYAGLIARIGLLTCDKYRELRDNIPPVDSPWWTATADSSEEGFVVTVNRDGKLGFMGSSMRGNGIRPVCVFDTEELEKIMEKREMCSFCEKLEILKKYQSSEYKTMKTAAIAETVLLDGKIRSRTIHYKANGRGFPLRFCPECGKKIGGC